MFSAGQSNYYYESVQKFYKNQGKDSIDNFYRFFEAPGMGHCAGGDGATAFGNSGSEELFPLTNTSTHDVVFAMVDWVEEGKAPEKIIAARYTNNNATLGVNFTRPLCAVRLSYLPSCMPTKLGITSYPNERHILVVAKT